MKKLLFALILTLPLVAQNPILRDLNCADAGANDTYACSFTVAPSAYSTGMRYLFKANTANTGAATVNFNSLGAKTIKKVAGGVTTDLSDNDIRAGQWVELVYDGTNMQMVSALGNATSGGYDPSDANTVYQTDEFNGFINNSGLYLYGNLFWRGSGVGTAPTISVNGVSGRLGVVRVATSAVNSSQDGYFFREADPVIASQVTGGSGTTWTYYVNVEATTTAKYRIGMSTGIGGGTGWPGGAYHAAMIEYDTSAGDSNWMCVTTNNGGGGTRTSIGVAPTPGTYQKLTIVASASNQVTCGVDGTTVTNTLTMPTNDMVEVIYVGNTTTTSRYLDVDRYQLKFVTSGR